MICSSRQFILTVPFIHSVPGREAATQTLSLSQAGVHADSSGKVVVDERERTSAPHIHAIGDVAHVCTCGTKYSRGWVMQGQDDQQ